MYISTTIRNAYLEKIENDTPLYVREEPDMLKSKTPISPYERRPVKGPALYAYYKS